MSKKTIISKKIVWLLIAYIGSFFVVGECKWLQGFLDTWLSKTYIKSYLRLTLPIIVPIITVLSTWYFYMKGEEKQRDEERKREREKREENSKQVRPYFYTIGNMANKRLYFTTFISKEIVLTDVKLFYINCNYAIEQDKNIGTLTKEMLLDKNAHYIERDLYLASLYIILRARTMSKEVVCFVHKTDDRQEFNLIMDNEKREKCELCWLDMSGNVFQHQLLNSILDEIESKKWENEKKDNFEFCQECEYVMRRMAQQPDNIAELHLVIALMRYYPEKFTDNIRIELLENLKNVLVSANLKKNVTKTSNQYFRNNLIESGPFFDKYKELFEIADRDDKTIVPTQMVSYIYDYIQQYEENIAKKVPMDIDFALRNVEVYIRDDISGKINNDARNNIIEILVQILNKESCEKDVLL